MKRSLPALAASVLLLLNQAHAQRSEVVVYTTAQNTSYRITPTDTLKFASATQPVETNICIFVDPTHTFQTFVGIGGALTDAAAETFAKLPADKQAEFLKAYYDKANGIGYSLARTSIHSSDFSSSSYTYVEDNDVSLKTFSLSHDQQFRIPFIKKVLTAAGGKLTMFASPWSPPAWMKDNNDMLHGGKLLEKYKQTWANYYIAFIKAYQKEGIPIWGLTVQNEPMAVQRWESCIYTGEDERDFIKRYLGPTLQKNGMSDKKLIAWDHNRDLMYQRASAVLNDPEAAKYVWGTGYHWYETFQDGGMQFENVKRVAEAFPNKQLIFTEGCVDRFNYDSIYNWSMGEQYGHSMVNDFNAGTAAWTDWNVLVDETGGPNHVSNFCFAPIIGDTKKGELLYTNSYYYIGHFSKFIRPGAKRISCSSNREGLEATAFKNTDGSTAVVVLNTGKKKLNYKLWVNGTAVNTVSRPHSISTLVY